MDASAADTAGVVVPDGEGTWACDPGMAVAVRVPLTVAGVVSSDSRLASDCSSSVAVVGMK